MNPKYWKINTLEDLVAMFLELVGEKCDSFRGTLHCWPVDDKASKPAGWAAEFVDWAGHTFKIELGRQTHIVLTSEGLLHPFTEEDFAKFQGIFVAMAQTQG